jgi:hypothetical protein
MRYGGLRPSSAIHVNLAFPQHHSSPTNASSMEDETVRLASKVQELEDIELAALLCLIAQEHCIIEADEEELDNVAQELGLVSL